jgi:uncharacterized membrane protein YfcA
MNLLDMMNKVGGRKLSATLLMFISSTAFLIAELGGVDFQQWANFNLILVGIYVGGNVGSSLVNGKKPTK